MNRRLTWERDGRDWPHREASRFVSSDGLRWHVQQMGSGPHLLLLHGTGASTHSVRRVMTLLSRKFTVTVPDLPGHGFTDMPKRQRLTLPGMAADVARLMHALDISPTVVAGHSAGAAILIRAVLDGYLSPQAIVSINGALLPFGSAIGQFFSPVAKLLVMAPLVPQMFNWRASNPSAVAELLRGTGSDPSDEDVELYGRLFRNPAHVEATLAMMANWDLNSLARDLPRLPVPLTLVVGSNDRAISPADAERVRQMTKSARVVTVAGAGHLAHEDRPDEVAGIITSAAKAAGPLRHGTAEPPR